MSEIIYKIKKKENYKVGVFSLFDIIGFDRERDFLEGNEVLINENEFNLINNLPDNYKQTIEIIEEA